MATTRLKITRAQLKAIIGDDAEALKQFEQLFTVVDAIAPELVLDNVTRLGSVSAKTDIALGLLSFLGAQLARLEGNAKRNVSEARVQQLESKIRALESRPRFNLPNKFTVDYLDFNGSVPHVDKQRRVVWNDADDTINIHHSGGVIQQVGEEVYMRVVNHSGADIPNGTAVRFAGVNGDEFIEIEPLIADGTVPSLYTIGVTTEDIADDAFGRVTVWGRVRFVDTTGTPVTETWAVGDILYAHPTISGALTNAKPTAPDIVVPIAAVLRVNATTGEIFVRPTIEQQEWFGDFCDTTDQTMGAAYTPQAVTFNTTNFANGFSVVSGSEITADASGLYDLQFSLQLESGSASTKLVHIWLRKNGADVANSMGHVTIAGSNTTMVPAWNYVVSLDATDYVELMWASDDANISLSHHAAEVGAVGTATFARPATPSAIVTITQVAQ